MYDKNNKIIKKCENTRENTCNKFVGVIGLSNLNHANKRADLKILKLNNKFIHIIILCLVFK